MGILYINGESREIDTGIIRQKIHEKLPSCWGNERTEEIVDEICFRIESLEFDNPDFIPEEKYAMACINYILEEGDGDPVGIDLLIKEIDDCKIWDYLDEEEFNFDDWYENLDDIEQEEYMKWRAESTDDYDL